MLNKLQKDNKLEMNYTIWESTDDYCKQYRCRTSLYFHSLLYPNYIITIYRMMSVPGHSNDIVDAINVCIQQY